MDRNKNRRPAGSSAGLDPVVQLFSDLIRSENEQASRLLTNQITGMDSAPAFLLARLHEGNPDERWWAVRVLSELSQVEARAAVRRALDDSNHEVRLCAALALRNHPDPEALSKLGELLTAEERLLARLAGDALIGLGDLATPILVDTLENGPQIARVEAVRALAHTDDLQAVSALFNCLDDESAIVAYWVDLALERRGIGMVFYNQ